MLYFITGRNKMCFYHNFKGKYVYRDKKNTDFILYIYLN
jgi:hypothetical protein